MQQFEYKAFNKPEFYLNKAVVNKIWIVINAKIKNDKKNKRRKLLEQNEILSKLGWT